MSEESDRAQRAHWISLVPAVGAKLHRRAKGTPKPEWVSGKVVVRFDDDKLGPAVVVRWWVPRKRHHSLEVDECWLFGMSIEIGMFHVGPAPKDPPA